MPHLISPTESSPDKYHLWFRRLVIYLVILPGIPFLLFSLGFFVFAYFPRDFDAQTQLLLKDEAGSVTLLFHGVNDTTNSWATPLANEINHQSDLSSANEWATAIDWREYADNILACSVLGSQLGSALAKQITKHPGIRRVHAVGHSCGAFVAYQLCRSLKEHNPQILVHTTYLDPVSVYAGINWRYGVEHFGDCADFSDAWIDTEDTVPGSNERLPHAFTFDVTQAKYSLAPDTPPHAWPAEFYRIAYGQGNVPLLTDSDSPASLRKIYPTGKLQSLDKLPD